MVDKAKVTEVIDKIKPYLRADGGDIELVEVDDEGVVKVRLQGACRGCPGARMTLKMGVEARLKKEVPDVVRVDAVD
ncbi:MAG: NifU family protein [Candidatus Hydrogenedentes bacterium]|nr:NifU family protein [Candidatus Hydrogenedentota bacterium]